MATIFFLEPGICISSLLFSSSSSIFFSPKLPHLLPSSSRPSHIASDGQAIRRRCPSPLVSSTESHLHLSPRSALNHPHNSQSFPHHSYLSFISNRSKQPASSIVCSHTSQPPSSAPRSSKPSHLAAPRFLPPAEPPFPLLLCFPSRPQAASTIAAGFASSEQPAISIRRRHSFPLRCTCSRRGFSLHRRAAGLFVSSTISGSAPAGASSDRHELLPLLSTASYRHRSLPLSAAHLFLGLSSPQLPPARSLSPAHTRAAGPVSLPLAESPFPRLRSRSGSVGTRSAMPSSPRRHLASPPAASGAGLPPRPSSRLAVSPSNPAPYSLDPTPQKIRTAADASADASSRKLLRAPGCAPRQC